MQINLSILLTVYRASCGLTWVFVNLQYSAWVFSGLRFTNVSCTVDIRYSTCVLCILETYICEYLICISRLSSVSFRLLCAYVYLCKIADLGHCYLVRFYDYIVTYICILKATRLSYSLTESFTVLCVSCKLVNYLAAAIDRFLCVQL